MLVCVGNRTTGTEFTLFTARHTIFKHWPPQFSRLGDGGKQTIVRSCPSTPPQHRPCGRWGSGDASLFLVTSWVELGRGPEREPATWRPWGRRQMSFTLLGPAPTGLTAVAGRLVHEWGNGLGRAGTGLGLCLWVLGSGGRGGRGLACLMSSF